MLGLYDDTLSCKVECKSLRKSLPGGSIEAVSIRAVSTEYMGRGQPQRAALIEHFQFPRTLDARYGDIAVPYPPPNS